MRALPWNQIQRSDSNSFMGYSKHHSNSFHWVFCLQISILFTSFYDIKTIKLDSVTILLFISSTCIRYYFNMYSYTLCKTSWYTSLPNSLSFISFSFFLFWEASKPLLDCLHVNRWPWAAPYIIIVSDLHAYIHTTHTYIPTHV